MKKGLFGFLFVCLSVVLSPVYSQIAVDKGRVDTLEVWSDAMQKSIKTVVVLPAGYDSANKAKYPVLYLLHGYGGRYDVWVKQTKTTLPFDATRWGMIIVCADGNNSWYWDSPVDSTYRYDTYISKELVASIDGHYNTIALPKGRAVTGFSMGGHGGLWQGINHPDVFGACGSMSGGVDIRPFPKNWEMSERLGSYKDNGEVWDSHTVMTQLDKIEPNKLAIIIDCGRDDFFFQVNEALHKEMLYRNIAHDYIVRPGAHTHEYWNNALDYQMLYFCKFFNRN